MLNTTKCKVLCDDVECEFKRVCGNGIQQKSECMIELKNAIRFLETHGVSTCEVGMGQVCLGETEENDNIIYKLKYRGRV